MRRFVTRVCAPSLVLALAGVGCEDSKGSTDDAGVAIDADRDGFAEADDCDDRDPTVNPDAVEKCDGIDNDCNGAVDEGVGDPWYPDGDADGFGRDGDPQYACTAPAGHVPNDQDCADEDPGIFPGALELCDGVDSNCDGIPDPTSCRPLSSSDVILAGDVSGGGFGDALLALGDVDGDGHGTFLVGAPGVSGDLPRSGAVYAFDGPLDVGGGPSSAVARFVGEDVDANVGASLALLDDIDGDGISEVLVSAWGDPTGGGGAGAVLVLGAEQFSAGPVDGADALFRVFGEAPGDSAGLGLAGLGDMNGDGRAELLVGAPNADGVDGTTSAGVAYVVSGATVGEVSLALAMGQISGGAEGSYIGEVVDGPGDLDGDGIPDVLLGSQYDDRGAVDAGAVFVFLGPISGSVSLGEADGVLTGEDAGDGAGSAVKGIGDIDDDGIVDVLVGAPNNGAGGETAGAAYLVHGPPSAWTTLADAAGRLIGRNPGDHAGNALAGLPDVNGDGQIDLLVGAYIDDSAALNAGSAYLVFGPLSGTRFLADADGGFIGEQEGDLAGWTVASGDDIDQDGLTDVLVGARRQDRGAADAGTVYVLYGAGL